MSHHRKSRSQGPDPSTDPAPVAHGTDNPTLPAPGTLVNDPPPEADGRHTTDTNASIPGVFRPHEDDGSGPAPGDAAPAFPESPVEKLLAGARRIRDYRREGAKLVRTTEIPLRATPYAGIPFRSWPYLEDYFGCYILRPAKADGPKDIFIVKTDVAMLPFVRPKVRLGQLVPCLTSSGKLFVWGMTLSDPADKGGAKVFKALEEIAEYTRTTGWASVTWDPMRMETPCEPIDEPDWSSDQPLDEIYYLAMKDMYITSPDHEEIKKLNTVVVKKFDTRPNSKGG
jgi:hypothetical protein